MMMMTTIDMTARGSMLTDLRGRLTEDEACGVFLPHGAVQLPVPEEDRPTHRRARKEADELSASLTRGELVSLLWALGVPLFDEDEDDDEPYCEETEMATMRTSLVVALMDRWFPTKFRNARGGR